MALTTERRQRATGRPQPRPASRPPRWRRRRGPNVIGGFFALVWLALVIVPIWFIVVSGLRSRDDFLDSALPVPSRLTLENVRMVLDAGFFTFFVNTAIVTVVCVALTLALALPAAYAVIRCPHRLMRAGFSVFLLGLAVPAQAAIVPIYLMITRLHLYDSLTAIVLPTAAFSLPLSMVVLTSTLRDIPNDLYEAMTVDGAGSGRIFRQLVVPLSRPGLITICIFSVLNAWNGFLFPLVLTQDPRQRVLPLGLWNFQGQYGTDVPGLMAAVVLSALPVFALYLFGRRYLIRGLTAGFGR
jgi:raffinose/stachyose/melibiose transport system permease protein/xylobiose transport system permease protein